MKKLYTYIILLSSVVWFTKVVAQDKQVWLHGKVVHQADSVSIPLAQIASYQKVNLFAADSVGEFRVILSANDSIKVIALGFEPRVFHLSTMNIHPDEVVLLPLKRASYLIKQVDINFYKGYNDYTSHLKEIRNKQKEMDLHLPAHIQLGRAPEIPPDIQPTFKENPGIVGAIASPLSFMYFHTSKSEKRKRKMVKLMEQNKLRKLLSTDLIKSVSGLEGEELQEFIVYCNANVKFKKNDNETSIKYKVIDLFKVFKMKK